MIKLLLEEECLPHLQKSVYDTNQVLGPGSAHLVSANDKAAQSALKGLARIGAKIRSQEKRC